MAGFGTRFLPATKSMPKELMPVVDKPLIQYAAEEAVRAGIDTLIFVTGRHRRPLRQQSRAGGGTPRQGQARAGRHGPQYPARRRRVRQAEQLGLGHAVLCAERVVGHEPFAVLLADDFIVAAGKSQLSVMKVEGEDISKYGVVVPGEIDGSVRGLIEKPKYEDAPSDLASIGRYVLTPDVFEILRGQEPGAGGEIQLADAINKMAITGDVASNVLGGRRFDCGSVRGYLDATMAMAERRARKV